ncbi:MAG: hypothetical protein MJ153_01615 [Clostridia bacterium]|nr:hypothetical protein [Clostridia bacterium]
MVNSSLIRKILIYFVYTMIIVCFQVSFPEVLTFNHQVADLMFVYVCLVGYFFGIKDGLIIGAVVGICRDVLATPILVGLDGKANTFYGIGLIVLLLISFFSANFFTKQTKRKFTFAMVDVIVMTVLYKSVGNIFVWLYNVLIVGNQYTVTLSQVLLDSITTQFIINFICAVPIYLLLRFVGPYKGGINPVLLNRTEFGGDDTWLTI